MPMSSYYLHLQPKRQAGLIVDAASLPRIVGTSEWVADGAGGLTWQTPTGGSPQTEHMAYQDDGFYVVRYGDAPGYPVTSILTKVIDVNTGDFGTMPAPYAWYGPRFQFEHPWLICQWGDCLGTKWYWQSIFTPGQTVTNPCYYIPTLRTQSDCLLQQECWYWDDARGWAVGAQSTGRPFDAAGNPTLDGVHIVYGTESTWAVNLGLWTHRELPSGPMQGCYSTWSY